MAYGAMRDGKARTYVVAEIVVALEFVDRVAAELAAHARKNDVPFKTDAGILHRLRRDQPARHRPFAVHQRITIDLAVVEPGLVIDPVAGVDETRCVLARHDGVEVAVEGQ